MDLGLLYRTYVQGNRSYMVSTVIAFFPFGSPDKLESELKLWPLVSEELGNDGVLDSGMPKVGAEYLVAGKFYPQDGHPVTAGSVRVQVGNHNKALNIFGDRHWIREIGKGWKLSEPKKITDLDLRYEYAFGGSEFPENPTGKGYVKNIEEYSDHVIAVPNIALPEQPIASPDQKIIPAGFAPYDLTWPQRYSKIGTYDEHWLNNSFPGLADDLDPSFFNTAPVDQQFAEPFQGKEQFSCHNMHPEKQLISSRLPGIRVRCFVNDHEEALGELHELVMRPDTLWLFPHRECGVLLFRGQLEVVDDLASSLFQMLVAYEYIDDEPRDGTHYQQALAARLDKEKGHLQAFNEKDLIPEGAESTIKALMKDADTALGEGILEKNLQKKSEEEIEAAWEKIKDFGLNPDDFKKTSEQDTVDLTLDNLDQLDELIDKMNKEAQERDKKLEESLRKMAQSMGKDYDQLLEEAGKKQKERMRFSADDLIAQLRENNIHDPVKEEKFRKIEKEFDKLNLQYGHFFDPLPPPSQESRDIMRQTILQAFEAGESLAGGEFPGVDLSGLNLTGIDLSHCFLEGADFNGTTLSNAKLNQSMLARANLSHVRASNADFTEANLGKTDISGAGFTECLLERIVLYQATLNDASFMNGRMAEADCSECYGNGVNFTGVDLRNARFLESQLNGADFSNSDLSEALFCNASVENGRFLSARLEQTVFVQLKGNGTNFENAHMENLRTAMDTTLREANFSHSNLKDANLREVDLRQANFTEAVLTGADLSKCRLEGSTFYRAVAKQTSFMQANLTQTNMVSINLMEGSLQKAILAGCDFRGANLFGADLLQADFSTALLDQANTEKTILSKRSSQ